VNDKEIEIITYDNIKLSKNNSSENISFSPKIELLNDYWFIIKVLMKNKIKVTKSYKVSK